MIRALVLWLLWSTAAMAQDLGGLARIDPSNSALRGRGDEMTLTLALSQTIPYRVFTLTEPARLVVDFREVDWRGIIREDLLATSLVSDLRFGSFRAGWSRLVADLTGPFALSSAGLETDPQTGAAILTVQLERTTAADFVARSGAPTDFGWETPRVTLPTVPPEDETAVVVIDPGHGGIDPGAQRGGVDEADLMLALGIELADRLNAGGNVRAILTREADVFVSLNERMSIARRHEADLMISLHADALEENQARGASVYTLSEEGEDSAAQRMAERHERGDLLAGVDLTGQGDRVATVLMELARTRTSPASDRFAKTLVTALREQGARLNSKPRREGRLAVLTSPDFSSVLVEVGFLSSDRDRQQLQSAEGRAPIVAGLALAVERWVLAEAALQPLIRQ